MREIYIIAGEIRLDDGPLERRALDIQDKLIQDIAATKGCLSYFEEGICSDAADICNHILNEVARSLRRRDGPDRESVMRMMREEAALYAGVAPESIHALLHVRCQGTDMRYRPTEEAFDPLEYLHGKIPHELYRKIEDAFALARRMGLEWEAIQRLYDIDETRKLIDAKRDAIMFENICRYGQDVNVFSVGGPRALQDLMAGEHDFKVYRVDVAIDRGKVRLRGELPWDLEAKLSYLREKGVDTRVTFRLSA